MKMKTRLLIPLITLLTLLSLVACDNDGKYVSRGNSVYYTYWTFSFGQRYDSLPGSDASTFKKVDNWLGYDARQVYFKDRVVHGADGPSLEVVKFPLYRDKNNFFYEEKAMNVADPATFKVIKWIDDDFWARDSRYAYFDTICIKGVDLATFKVKKWHTAIDKNHVYLFGKVLPLADPATYEENWKGPYSRDKSHIWCYGDLLEDVDYATFDVDDNGDGFDKYGKFHFEKRVTDETVPEEAATTE